MKHRSKNRDRGLSRSRARETVCRRRHEALVLFFLGYGETGVKKGKQIDDNSDAQSRTDAHLRVSTHVSLHNILSRYVFSRLTRQRNIELESLSTTVEETELSAAGQVHPNSSTRRTSTHTVVRLSYRGENDVQIS